MTGSVPGLHFNGTASIDGRLLFGPIDLAAESGRWTCLLGPSGVGKSTLLRLFAGLNRHVQVSGRAAATDKQPLEGRIALMAQRDLLLPWLSVLDNVMLGARLRGERAERARAHRVLERVGLAACTSRSPSALSGGERQRVALARTLMENRPVVLLDEPFSALDAGTRATMQSLAADVLAARTVLHVTHDPAEAARLAHRTLLLDRHGLQQLAMPPGDVPRAVDEAQVLAVQARMIRQLMTASV